MGRKATALQTASTTARARRVELDRQRDQRDRRVEQAAAEVLVLLEQRAVMERDLERVDSALGQSLRRVLADGLTHAQAAAMCGIEPVDVRRLVRLTAAAAAAVGGSSHPESDSAAGDGSGPAPTVSPQARHSTSDRGSPPGHEAIPQPSGDTCGSGFP